METRRLALPNSSKSYLTWLLATAAVFGVVIFFLPVRFETNDDVLMLLLASGKYSGTPEPHLVFINYLYGLFITALYRSWPQAEWYTIVFVILHGISFSLISWIVVNHRSKALYKVLFLALFFILEIRLLLLLQFTTTAALCSLAGLLLMRQATNKLQTFLGLSLFLVGFMIRLEAAALVFLILLPVLAVNAEGEIWLFRRYKVIVLAVSVALSMYLVDYNAYHQNSDWSYYRSYNKLRGEINDNNNAYRVGELPKNISRQDYQLLLGFFPDGKVIDLPKIKTLHAEIKKTDFLDKLQNTTQLLSYRETLIPLFLLFLLILYTCKGRAQRYVLTFTFSAFVLALCYASLEAAVRERVFFSALLPLLFVMYACAHSTGKKYPEIAICLLVSFFIVSSTNASAGIIRSFEENNDVLEQQLSVIDQFLNKSPNALAIYGADLSLESSPAFSVSDNFRTRKIYFSGWLTGYPLNKENFSSYLDLVDKNAIFVGKSPSRIKTIKMLYNCINEHYQKDVIAKVEAENRNFAVIKFYSGPTK